MGPLPPGSFLGRSWEARPGRLSWPLLPALGPLFAPGRSRRLLGASWGAPGGSLRRSWRLPGGSWGPLGGSKVAFCRKAEFRRQYIFFMVFWGSGRPPGASWGSLGALVAAPGALLAALGPPLVLLAGSWQGPVGPGWFLGGPGPGPSGLGIARNAEGSGAPYVFIV